MEWNLIFRDDEILEMITVGKFSKDDLIKMTLQFLTNQKWKAGTNIIADFRDVDLRHLKINDVFDIKKLHIRLDSMIGDGKVAAIIDSNLSYGFSRAYESISTSYVRSRIMSFRNYDTGIKWIKGNLETGFI